ncbi:hypothetical protein KY290_017344 [Solanum tuberosum]|uniref:Uncharacterized protein n=1 Tax=Solanum tuberosum TaxID=4113 RepID=A0ABQ7VCX2_SOLTU|nr:hypothetical protein KY290_017344 [Solanum tuberosum]
MSGADQGQGSGIKSRSSLEYGSRSVRGQGHGLGVKVGGGYLGRSSLGSRLGVTVNVGSQVSKFFYLYTNLLLQIKYNIKHIP